MSTNTVATVPRDMQPPNEGLPTGFGMDCDVTPFKALAASVSAFLLGAWALLWRRP